MKKFAMAVVMAFCLGGTGLLCADELNPQPLPPGRSMPTGGDGNKLTASDKDQITGNLNGDGKTLDSEGDHFPKARIANEKGFDKSKNSSKFSKHKNSKTGKDYMKQKGFIKSEKLGIGSQSSGAGSGKALAKDAAVDSFDKTNGFDKHTIGGNGGANQLPAVQKQ